MRSSATPDLDPADVALEIGGGEGALTERLAPRVAHVHVVELDAALADGLDALAERLGNVAVVRGDAMRVELSALEPAPTAVVSNLPYSIATPVLLRTIDELPEVRAWTVMVQREIADRLRAESGSRTYGAPSVLVQLACEVELLRAVDRAVFKPRPRVDSALLRLVRRGPAAPPGLVAGWCGAPSRTGESRWRARWSSPAARRGRGPRGAGRARARPGARAEALAPEDFARLAARLGSRMTLRAPAKLNLCLYWGGAAATDCTRSARSSAR